MSVCGSVNTITQNIMGYSTWIFSTWSGEFDIGYFADQGQGQGTKSSPFSTIQTVKS